MDYGYENDNKLLTPAINVMVTLLILKNFMFISYREPKIKSYTTSDAKYHLFKIILRYRGTKQRKNTKKYRSR